jgi:NADPH-dependent ferric siderophore reductase
MDRPIADRVRHELKFRLAEVVSNARVTPRMARITLVHPDFADFPSLAYDDHVKLFFPPAGSAPVMPVPGPNGLVWPEGTARPEGRDYTPRSFDRLRREVVIDFVLHQGGLASAWAEAAQTGSLLGIGGPRASFVVREGFDYHVLIGDETALPAIGRRIEELPEGSRVLAFIEIADAAERQAFSSNAVIELAWVTRSTGGSLLETVRAAAFPGGTGYVFIAGEAAMSAALREHFVTERGHDPDLVKAAGYWRRGEADFYDGHQH